MNGREKANGGQTKARHAQTQARQPDKQMVESAGMQTVAAKVPKSSLSSKGNNAIRSQKNNEA